MHRYIDGNMIIHVQLFRILFSAVIKYLKQARMQKSICTLQCEQYRVNSLLPAKIDSIL